MPRILYASNMLREYQKGRGVHVHTCAVCGKAFKATNDYIYIRYNGDNALWYCSYTCYQKNKNYISITEIYRNKESK